MRLADAIGITGFLHVQEKLGEMLLELEAFRAGFYGAEAHGRGRRPNGVWSGATSRARRRQPPEPRRSTRGSSRSSRPSPAGASSTPRREADLANPELRPAHRPVRARAVPGSSAEERIALFKLAWDVTGDSLRPADDPVREVLLGRPHPQLGAASTSATRPRTRCSTPSTGPSARPVPTAPSTTSRCPCRRSTPPTAPAPGAPPRGPCSAPTRHGSRADGEPPGGGRPRPADGRVHARPGRAGHRRGRPDRRDRRRAAR